MGNKNTSTNNRDINQLSDACRLSKIVTQAVGLRSNSASQTDTIMLTLENNLNYQKNITGLPTAEAIKLHLYRCSLIYLFLI